MSMSIHEPHETQFFLGPPNSVETQSFQVPLTDRFSVFVEEENTFLGSSEI